VVNELAYQALEKKQTAEAVTLFQRNVAAHPGSANAFDGLADGLAALQAAGTQVGTLSLVGGGSRSPFWAQLLADVLEVGVQTHQGGETGAALGAARLGHLACGGDEAAVCTRPPVARTFEPSRLAGASCGERLARFRELYPALAPLWRAGGAGRPG